jgi:AcrR family transcriptional regulator
MSCGVEPEPYEQAQTNKRSQLIETATNLAYRRGFRETSLAGIADPVAGH